MRNLFLYITYMYTTLQDDVRRCAIKYDEEGVYVDCEIINEICHSRHVSESTALKCVAAIVGKKYIRAAHFDGIPNGAVRLYRG